jgi:hypothetical protein
MLPLTSQKKYLNLLVVSTVFLICWSLGIGSIYWLFGFGGASKLVMDAIGIIFISGCVVIILGLSLRFSKKENKFPFYSLLVAILPAVFLLSLSGAIGYLSDYRIQRSQDKIIELLSQQVDAARFKYAIDPSESTGYYDINIQFELTAREPIRFSWLSFGIYDSGNNHLKYEGGDEKSVAIYKDRLIQEYQVISGGQAQSESYVYDSRASNKYLEPGIYLFSIAFEKWLQKTSKDNLESTKEKLDGYDFVAYKPTGGFLRVISFPLE